MGQKAISEMQKNTKKKMIRIQIKILKIILHYQIKIIIIINQII